MSDCGGLKKNKTKLALNGSITALVTPFMDNGSFDEEAFCSLIEWQIAEGTNAVLSMGTTGESAGIRKEERYRIIESCVRTVSGRVPVIAGAGSNNTSKTIFFVNEAEKAGVDAVLVVVPYYNRPTQKGLYEHYEAVAQSTSLPLLIYNIPSRCGVDIMPQTLAQLVNKYQNIIGIKDSTSDLRRVSLQRALCGKEFVQLSGDDFSSPGFNSQGGVGCISVTSNVAPRLCSEMQKAILDGKNEKALALHDSLFPLHEALFMETGAAGAKYALWRLGRIKNIVRAPLAKVEPETGKKIEEAMEKIGLFDKSFDTNLQCKGTGHENST